MISNTLKIGILFSQSGTMAVTEIAHLRGVLLAIQQINELGGIKGVLIKPIIYDPEGSDDNYALLATKLLIDDKVKIIFGCCLSSSRKRVLPIVERFNGLLFYPSVYEGFEYSPNIIYGGACPNQMIVPLLEHLFNNYGARYALVGSETYYAFEINRIVKEFLSENNKLLLLEEYCPLNSRENVYQKFAQKALHNHPDVILSTFVGQEAQYFYQSLYSANSSSPLPQLASLTTTESELYGLKPQERQGHLTVSSYFNDMKNEKSRLFVGCYQSLFNTNDLPGVYTQTAYFQVMQVKEAFSRLDLQKSNNLDINEFIKHLYSISLDLPGYEKLTIDSKTNHCFLKPLIGLSKLEGDFEIIWASEKLVTADPYMISYNRSIT